MTAPGAGRGTAQGYAAPGYTAQGWAAAIAAVTMWAGWAVATRGTLAARLAGLEVWDLVALRFMVAAVITLPIVLHRRPRLARLGAARGLMAACMGGFTFSLCNTGGFAFAPASHGGAMTAPLGAVFTGLLAAMVLGETLSRKRALGLGLIVSGVVAIVLANAVAAPPPGLFLGHALFVGAAAQWATYTVIVRRAGLYPLEALAVSCLGSALIYLPLWLVFRGPAVLLQTPWDTLVAQGLLHGVVGQTASIALFNLGALRLGAARAAACGALVPPMVAAGAFLFLGEVPRLAELPGLAALTVGVWLATAAAARPPPRG